MKRLLTFAQLANEAGMSARDARPLAMILRQGFSEWATGSEHEGVYTDEDLEFFVRWRSALEDVWATVQGGETSSHETGMAIDDDGPERQKFLAAAALLYRRYEQPRAA